MPIDPDPSVWDYLRTLPERLARRKLEPLQQAQQKAELPPQVFSADGPRISSAEQKPSEETECPSPAFSAPWRKTVKIRLDLPTILFAAGIFTYLLTRLLKIDEFPIYFFCDEAIQTMSAVDLIRNGFRDSAGNFLPAYFQNGGQYNLGLSVYWQLLPALLQRSVTLTRSFAALATLAFPLSMAYALKDIYKIKHWYLAPALAAAIPAWFLHSRTAFETCLGASMYSLFLYFYLKYRRQDRKYLYASLIFGALSFYAYTPMQMVMIVSGSILLIIDFRYHWQDKRTLLKGFLFLAVLAAPDLIFRRNHQQAIQQHLNLLHSYLLDPHLSVGKKLLYFLARYLRGFDPSYWFLPHQQDLVRHTMLGWGHMPLLFFPFTAIGAWQTMKNWSRAENRTLLAALAAAPSGAALVEPSITRLMVMVVPFAYLTIVGISLVLAFIRQKFKITKVSVAAAAVFLAVSGLWMTLDSLHNGPAWFTDYSLYGMQWGGKQVFSEIRSYLEVNPNDKVIITPSWANNTDVIGRFFLGDPLPVEFNSIHAYLSKLLPIDENTLFVLTPEEVDDLQKSGKFKPMVIKRILNWPDGRPGFYFLQLSYADNAAEIFEQEAAELARPMYDSVQLFGQTVAVEFSRIDMAKISAIFDGDQRSLTRTLRSNPFIIKLKFPEPVQISQATTTIGSPATQITMTAERPDGSQTEVETRVISIPDSIRPVPLMFEHPEEVSTLTLRILSIGEQEPTHVHVWELVFN